MYNKGEVKDSEKGMMTMRVQLFELEMKKVKSANVQLGETTITSPEIVFEFLRQFFNLEYKAQEVFGIICLNIKNKIIGVHLLSQGSLNSTIVHPREIFKSAMLNNASAIILFHNHPSGNPKPSEEDIEMTKRVCDAGHVVGIDVLDHVIVGDGEYASLKEQNKM